MSEAVITLHDIKKSYGKTEVLKNVNMEVKKGDIYGLIGKNGAGKTTLFKVILGLSDFQGGTVSLFGAKNEKENRMNRRRIGFFVGANFFSYLSGRENLDYYRRMKGIADKKEVDRVLEIVGLSQKAAKVQAGRYSLGMRQRLGLANAIMGNPELLILDEPTNGLDPQGIADIRNLITEINKDGTTILISSHILAELEHTAHCFGIVNEGVIMREMSLEDMAQMTGLTGLEVANEDVEKARKILEANGVRVRNVKKTSSSLEDFYFRIIGGDNNV